MRTRRKILIALLAVVLIAAAVVWRASQPKGVFAETYQGKTLFEWVNLNATFGSRQSPEQQAALRALASNHVPELIAALDYQPGWERNRALNWFPRPVQKWVLIHSRLMRANNAYFALSALGPDAAYILPELEKMVSGTNQANAGLVILTMGNLGTNAIPLLLQSATNGGNSRLQYVVIALENMNPTNLASDIPLLEQWASNSDRNISSFAMPLLENVRKTVPPGANIIRP